MRIDVLTLFPPLFEPFRNYGVVGRALGRGVAELQLWNPRDFTVDRNRTVDDRPYGGGPGMVLRPEPLQATLQAVRVARDDGAQTILLSPQGRRFDHAAARSLSAGPGFILLAGRYEGIDERLVQAEVDEEWSIGDYVLSGGELAAMVVVDAVVRQMPGVLGDEQSAVEDSFATGLLDHEHYTRPETFLGQRVPEVLLCGDHERIRRWRLKRALGRTWLRRPDLLSAEMGSEARALLEEFRQEYWTKVESS
ncbi:MAG TPA: tRNA (guanosine(37)-N1)-methyltransferase TrmD [Acidiferrobacteraceae bacterium]|nr:tRNA (guanosine(37)-N1)-methyltransferase TrmD [Acidiferrobacteraceae bacterium]